MASGVVIGLLGLWILLRTISSGSSGGNLADYLLGLGNQSTPSSKASAKSSGAPSSPAPSTTPGHIATVGQPVPNLGGIGHRNIP